MADRYCKHVPSGQVFIYQSAFINREDFVECADAQGNPIGETIEGTAVRVDEAPKKGRKKASSAMSELDEALSEEASRGL